MIEILREQEATRSEGHPFVFPGRKAKRPLDGSAVLLKRMGVGAEAVAHGFRSSSRDWAGDETDFAREVIEHALAHKVRGVEGDYRRGTAFKKRRELMELQCDYCGETPEGKVISIRR
jgi:hypothetical protein